MRRNYAYVFTLFIFLPLYIQKKNEKILG